MLPVQSPSFVLEHHLPQRQQLLQTWTPVEQASLHHHHHHHSHHHQLQLGYPAVVEWVTYAGYPHHHLNQQQQVVGVGGVVQHAVAVPPSVARVTPPVQRSDQSVSLEVEDHHHHHQTAAAAGVVVVVVVVTGLPPALTHPTCRWCCAVVRQVVPTRTAQHRYHQMHQHCCHLTV